MTLFFLGGEGKVGDDVALFSTRDEGVGEGTFVKYLEEGRLAFVPYVFSTGADFAVEVEGRGAEALLWTLRTLAFEDFFGGGIEEEEEEVEEAAEDGGGAGAREGPSRKASSEKARSGTVQSKLSQRGSEAVRRKGSRRVPTFVRTDATPLWNRPSLTLGRI